MAFSDDMKDVRTAIKSALSRTGFEPIIIDEKDIDSDKTINDAIISNLRQCKFCVADFSYHRNGVYFESGFALGQGKQVIYLCEKTQFDKAHFDIKPLQHIIYETTQELEKKLVDKIEAWIK
jgi:nucleoside 2-deoxyribosyltransferase